MPATNATAQTGGRLSFEAPNGGVKGSIWVRSSAIEAATPAARIKLSQRISVATAHSRVCSPSIAIATEREEEA